MESWEKMFIFTLVNLGSEKCLKEEILIKYPDLKFAYSKSGFLTFKNINENSNNKFNLIFARRYGKTISKYNKLDMERYIEENKNQYKLQIYTNELEILKSETANIGDTILNVIKISENEYWLGTNKVDRFDWNMGGASPKLTLPDLSPSRAYLKIAEAVIWSNFDIKNRVVLEFGSAPGGAVYYLLENNCTVYGVDMGKMDNICLSNPKYTHISSPMQNITKDDLPENIDTLLCDVNLSPLDVIPHLLKIIKINPSIDSVFYTLKIGNKISIKNILEYIDKLKNTKFKTIKATQLPSNKSEILVFMKK